MHETLAVRWIFFETSALTGEDCSDGDWRSTQDLRKVYSAAPPLGAGGGLVGRADAKDGKQPKAQIPALDGLSLNPCRRNLRPSGPERRGQIHHSWCPDHSGAANLRPSLDGEHDVWKEQTQVKHLIGVVPQRPNLDFSLTAREILVFHAAYFGIGSKQRNERADGLLEKFKLTEPTRGSHPETSAPPPPWRERERERERKKRAQACLSQ